MTVALHWYLANWYHIAFTWGTITALSMVFGWLWAKRRLLPLLREHADRQRQIEDMLDTRTAGGLQDVVNAVRMLDTETPGGLKDVLDALNRQQSEPPQ